MSIRILATSLMLLFVTSETIYAQSDATTTKHSLETSNCRVRSQVDLYRDAYSVDTVGRAECLTIQALSILSMNSFIAGQWERHADHVIHPDHGVVDFVDPTTGVMEQCEYSVTEGQKIAPFILRLINNEIQADVDGVSSLAAALAKARRDALKSVFIGCAIS